MPSLASQAGDFNFDLTGGTCPIPTTVTKVDCADSSEAKNAKHVSTVCHTCDNRHCDEKHTAQVNPEKRN